MDLITSYKIATKPKKRNKKIIQEPKPNYIKVERATEDNKFIIEL